jgi:hypothetical protein
MTRRLACLGLLCAAAIQLTATSPASAVDVDLHGCTSTSRCNGAALEENGEFEQCVDDFCVSGPCHRVAVWFVDEDDDPTVSQGICPIILPGR